MNISVHSQVMEVYSVFMGFVTQLCSPSNDVTVCETWSHVCILSIFTMVGIAVLSSLHSGVVVLS